MVSSGTMWINVGVLGTQDRLRTLQYILHIGRQFDKLTVQANLHATQCNLHDFFVPIFLLSVFLLPIFFALNFLQAVLHFFCNRSCNFFVRVVEVRGTLWALWVSSRVPAGQ